MSVQESTTSAVVATVVGNAVAVSISMTAADDEDECTTLLIGHQGRGGWDFVRIIAAFWTIFSEFSDFLEGVKGVVSDCFFTIRHKRSFFVCGGGLLLQPLLPPAAEVHHHHLVSDFRVKAKRGRGGKRVNA